jgi:hypothetical protein
MRIPIYYLCCFLLACSLAEAQAAGPSDGPFPALAEFSEFRAIVSEQSFEEPARLAKVEDGRLISDVGFEKFARRVYSTGESGEVSITIVTLMDFRAAYSLLTMRSSSTLREGPPGDAFASDPAGMTFCQGRYWVRITGRSAPKDLLQRLAESISKRLGSRDSKPPSLIKRLPGTGYDASSLKYFPGLKSFESYSGTRAFQSFHLNFDAEIAQARYALDGQSGTLTLLYFPTPEVGEEYFADLSAAAPGGVPTDKTYLKRAGPLVAILKGNMDPAAADRILGPVSHSYAIRWIYEKPKKKGITWGVPVRILHTVVNSILFVVVLCIVAILAGAGTALGRFLMRRRASRNTRDGLGPNDSARLRLR